MLFVILLYSVTLLVTDCSCSDSTCPLWTYRHNATSSCECGTTANGIIQCNKTTGELNLHLCACLTKDPSTNKTIVGYCPYSCVAYYYQPLHRLDMNSSSSTMELCNMFNRDGPLCSQCPHDHGIPLYTYDIKCVKCPRFEFQLLIRFLAISLLPQTLLCVIVTIFHLHILRPPWSVFGVTAQIFSTPIIMQSGLNYSITSVQNIVTRIIATIYGPLNLDFFRAIYTPQCISPHVSPIQMVMIDGLVGLYPLLLIGVVYYLVKLQDRGCRVAVKIKSLCSRFRGTFKIKASLIETFSTFFLLSYMKITFAAFYILAPTRVWSPDGSYVWAVYIEPSLAYFRFPHFVYATPTLLLAILLVIIPLCVLFLYQYQWFQRLLHHFHLRSLALNTFVDVFQGCYKDGTNGTRDCRFFASLQLVMRLIFPSAFFITKVPLLSVFVSSVVFGSYITAFVILRPYKEALYNKTDIPLLMTSGLMVIFVNISVLFEVYHYSSHFLTCVTIVCVTSPLIYLIIWQFVYFKPLITRCVKSWRQHQPETEELLPTPIQ